MTTCLLGLGSNLGDREAALRAAIAEIAALPDVQVVRHSEWHRSRPIGGLEGQSEFLNAAAVIETTIEPLPLLSELQQIESRHGRQRDERWSSRTLDIDLLLYSNEVSETEMLTLPHPRMSFRRFVLAPCSKIAPKMLHPIIGWPIERLLLHLERASNLLALVSPSDRLRQQVAELLEQRFVAEPADRPTFATADHHWPPQWTTWLGFFTVAPAHPPGTDESSTLPYAAAAFPKLSILLDADVARRGAVKLDWSTTVRAPGRGPTLRLQTTDPAEIEAEVFAAMESVWPDLGPTETNRLKS
jgi:2-amino-4-hydroxy-6-hydroxymethyldihydropteridine diphosphokinase